MAAKTTPKKKSYLIVDVQKDGSNFIPDSGEIGWSFAHTPEEALSEHLDVMGWSEYDSHLFLVFEPGDVDSYIVEPKSTFKITKGLRK